ncbi:Aminomethyltransferase, partial [Gryllus bimaculatus]
RCLPQVWSRALGSAARAEGPQRTPLYELHVAQGAKMVAFSGFLLPVAYAAQGIAASHLHTRSEACASLFDVSHMMQTEVRGKDAVEFMESLCTADLRGLPDNVSALTAFTDPITGGILDDLIVTKTPLGYLHVVSNASRRAEDQQIMLRAERAFAARGKCVRLRFFGAEERALLALQGPGAARALQPLTEVDVGQLRFMGSTLAEVAGAPARLTRCGYTGEDGVEVAVAADRAAHVAQALLDSAHADVRPAGLGARDSLRLEAGLCLYGNDIDHTTTPVEAGLTWIIGKRRREAADFPGAAVVLRQLREGPKRRRVGLRAVAGGPPFR